MEHEDDMRLVGDVLAGDARARAEFVERMRCVSRMLVARNNRIGAPLSRDELLDVVQDTFVALWTRLDSYAGRATLESWAFRFCHLCMLRHLERLERRNALLRLASPLLARGGVDDTDETAGERESFARILALLSRREAEVTRLRYLEQLEFTEIGAALGISPSSAKTHCYRALDKLRGLVASTARGGRS